jgi:adenylate cyclase
MTLAQKASSAAKTPENQRSNLPSLALPFAFSAETHRSASQRECTMSGNGQKKHEKWWKPNSDKWKSRLALSPLKITVVVMFLFLGSLVRHYQMPRGARNLDWVGTLERILLDTRFQLRGPRPVSGQTGILAIDEQSVARFGRWPFPRATYEKGLANLKKAGVHWIGFDAIFSEPERPYLDESIEGIQTALMEADKPKGFDVDVFSESMNTLLESSKGDESFGRALKKFGNIVHGYFYFESIAGIEYDWRLHHKRLKPSAIDMVAFEGKTNKNLAAFPDMITNGALTSTSIIAPQGASMGFFNNTIDTDGIVRAGVLVKGLQPLDEKGKPSAEPILLPSLALNLASKYLNREIIVKFDDVGVDSVQLMDPDGVKNPITLPLSRDAQGRMYINHYGPEGTFPHISLVDAVDGKFPKRMPKILLFGAVGTGMNDIRPSPFSESFNGVEHHAAILENILSQKFISRPLSSLALEAGILFATGLFFAVILTKTSAVASALTLVAFCVGFYLIDRQFIFGKGQWIYIGMVYLQSFSLFFSVTLFKYFTEEKEKKKIKNAFQHYLNPAVINDLMQNPDSLKLGGEKKELTVFFSDVRGFTTISETLTPEALSSLLNEYFTPMTNIILKSNGLLDKYIGDAVMAVWGAPISMADHADRALISSLQMLEVLDVLRDGWKARGLPLIDIGCGINTGPMVVGNMGSDQRFDYTVLGDSVNLGARLEGVTKEYGVKIICSEFTRRALKKPNFFVLRELDSIRVKGKNEPVMIYECMRFNAQNRQLCEDISGLFSKALVHYRRQAWADAEKVLLEILNLKPDDGPAMEFIERCHYLKEHAPGDSWNGVWVMKTK